MDKPIPLLTPVKVTYPRGELKAIVRYCVYREIGYFIGLEFEDGSRWSQHQYRPQHMLDPRHLMNKAKAASAAAETKVPVVVH